MFPKMKIFNNISLFIIKKNKKLTRFCEERKQSKTKFHGFVVK
jgi:hypothetical protein